MYQIYAIFWKKKICKTNRVEQTVKGIYNKYSNNQVMFIMLYLLTIDFMRVLNCADVPVIYSPETEIDTACVCTNLTVLSRFDDSDFSSVFTTLK